MPHEDDRGLAVGIDGYNAANKATMIYATYLEDDDKRKLELFQEISARCDKLRSAFARTDNAAYNAAYHYSARS